MDTQIKKGLLEIAILQLLCKQKMHGYQLMKEVSQYFDVNESGIYALLRRLCTLGYLEISLSNESLGPVRKIYGISRSGKEYLEIQCHELNKVIHALIDMGVTIKEV